MEREYCIWMPIRRDVCTYLSLPLNSHATMDSLSALRNQMLDIQEQLRDDKNKTMDEYDPELVRISAVSLTENTGPIVDETLINSAFVSYFKWIFNSNVAEGIVQGHYKQVDHIPIKVLKLHGLCVEDVEKQASKYGIDLIESGKRFV